MVAQVMMTNSRNSLGSGGADATQGFKNERDKRYPGSLAGCMREGPFLSSPTERVWSKQHFELNSKILRIEMTDMSKAAGRPRSQLERKTSAGQDWRLG